MSNTDQLRHYNVQIIYKAGMETIVYAANEEEAKQKAEKEVEMSGDHLETIAINASIANR